MSEISEAEIKSMTKEQNYMRGYKDGKSDVLDKIRAEIVKKHLSIVEKNDFDNGRTYGYEEVIEIIDKYKAESEVEE